MLDDFFFRALLGGIGVAVVAGPVGCFIIWRRLAYFGDTLSHSALLGVAMALLLELNITLSVFFISLIVSLLLLLLQKRASLSSDALLGLLAHATLAVGLVVLAFMTWVRVDLMGFLFGDILAVTTNDLAVIWFGGLAVLIGLSFIWRRLFAATVNYELARAEGAKPDFTNIVFMVLVAAVIAVSMKLVGVLLITALLIIPAATTMLGPAGVSHCSEPLRPTNTDSAPITAAITAICSGDLAKRLAVAAGIINRAVIRSTPTSFIETAITAATRTMKTMLVKSGFAPSAFASS